MSPEVSRAVFLVILNKMAVVLCPSAFRLRRLAHNDVPGFVCCHLALVKCPCACRQRRRAQNGTSQTEFVLIGRLSRDLAQSPLVEILFRDFAKRPLADILPTELLDRSCTRSCQENSHRDFVQKRSAESRGLPGRSFLDGLSRDLALRSLQDLLWRSLTERSLQETCQETSCRYLVQLSSQNSSLISSRVLRRDLS